MSPGSTRLYPIPEDFSLSELLDADQLDPYSSPHELKPYQKILKRSGLVIGRLSFLNADLELLALPTKLLDLCQATVRIKRFDVCATCPARQHPPPDDKVVPSRCAAGCVKRTLAAIRSNDKVVGYVRGPDIPTDDFYRLGLSQLPDGLGEDLLDHRNALQAMHHETIERAVSRVARRLSRRCELERRLKILRRIRRAIVHASTEHEVIDAGCGGLRSLFGEVDVCFYALDDEGVLQHRDARGPNFDKQPDALGKDQGHVGLVLRTQEPHYAPDLLEKSQGFIQLSDAKVPLRSAYTVPLVWGANEKPGAIQVASQIRDRFAKADRQSMRAVVDIMSMASVRIGMQRQSRAQGLAQISLGAWADCMIQAIAARADTVVQVLQSKRQLMQGFSDEALKITDSANAAVQVLNANTRTLRFAACSGPDWTDEAKAKEFKSYEPAPAVRALQNREHLVRDVKNESGFNPALGATKAVYAIRLGPRQNPVGVLSVCWQHILPQDNMPPHKEEVHRLVQQFESVFNILDSREREVLHKLVETLGSGSTLNSKELRGVAQETVDRTKAAFGVRGCSIFIVFPGQEAAKLVATTGILPKAPIWYIPGEGLTGWSLKTKRCLRLRDATDEAELRSIDPKLKGVRKYVEDAEYRDSHGKRAFLAAPMISEGRVFGVIRMTIKEDSSPFTPEEETLLAQIAAELAVTVKNGWKQAQAEQDLVAVAGQMQELHRIGLGFAEDYPDVNTLLQQVLSTAITQSEMRWGIIRLLDETKSCLVLRAWQGPPVEALPPELELNELVKNSLASPEPVVISDTHGLWKKLLSSSLNAARRIYLEMVRTAIHVPIRLKERAIGIIFLESPYAVEVPDRVRHFLGLLGGYAAVATELTQMRIIADSFFMTRTLLGGLPHEVIKRLDTLGELCKFIPQIGADPARLDQQLQYIHTELDLLGRLSRILLPFAVTDDPKTQLEPLPLKDILEECIESHHGSRQFTKQVPIVLDCDGQITLRTNKELITHVFSNLIVNANEAIERRMAAETEHGQRPQDGRLIVRVEESVNQTQVCFEDNGIGMDSDMKQDCLDVGKTIKKDKGHGMGLAFVQGVLTLHQGEVRVDSCPGKGSKFTLIFPSWSIQ